MRQSETNCWKIALSFYRRLGGTVWRLSPRYGIYVDRAHEPASGTIDEVFGGIENWTEHAVHIKNDFVRDPMMLGHTEPVPIEQWQTHWNHFNDHVFVRIRQGVFMSAHAVEDTRQKSLHTDWRENWEHRVENARSRPAMFIGNPETAHRGAVSDALALVRKAHAFRAPKLSTVHLSPTKYVVRAEAGPLLPAIEYLHTWNNKPLLTEGWDLALERLRQERFSRLFDEQPDFVGWKRYFASATGPTLEQPTYPAVLALEFTFLYKTSAGLWGQTFRQGYPVDEPFLLTRASEVGLLVLAQLDPHWFQGLPFTVDDVQKLSRNNDVTALWHADDQDLDVEAATISDLSRWL